MTTTDTPARRVSPADVMQTLATFAETFTTGDEFSVAVRAQGVDVSLHGHSDAEVREVLSVLDVNPFKVIEQQHKGFITRCYSNDDEPGLAHISGGLRVIHYAQDDSGAVR